MMHYVRIREMFFFKLRYNHAHLVKFTSCLILYILLRSVKVNCEKGRTTDGHQQDSTLETNPSLYLPCRSLIYWIWMVHSTSGVSWVAEPGGCRHRHKVWIDIDFNLSLVPKNFCWAAGFYCHGDHELARGLLMHIIAMLNNENLLLLDIHYCMA